jgi:hypothetical protein
MLGLTEMLFGFKSPGIPVINIVQVKAPEDRIASPFSISMRGKAEM